MSDLWGKERIIGLDIFRIVATLVVFLFHCNMHIGVQYGILTPFFSLGAIYMSAFFLLSGFSSYLVNSHINMHEYKMKIHFWLKRIIGILPLYYCSSLIYILISHEKVTTTIFLFPMELLCIQSTFTSSFLLTHNSGTWFISCIMICYCIYPFIQEIIKEISVKTKLCIIVLAYCVLCYAPFAVREFQLVETYTSIVFRSMEYIIGVILCSIMNEIRKNKLANKLFSWSVFVIEVLVIILLLTILGGCRVFFDESSVDLSLEKFMAYGMISIPIFILQLITLSNLSIRSNSLMYKIVLGLSRITYAFYLSQLVIWDLVSSLIELLNVKSDLIKVCIAFFICIIIAVVFHVLVECSVSRISKKYIKTIENWIFNKTRSY